MARSLAPFTGFQVLPDGIVEHRISGTKFQVRSSGTTTTQSLSRPGVSTVEIPAFVVGSGNHAFGFLMQVGDHLFQSPLSYYTNTKQWDVAPGYESDPAPDFSRPVTAECVFCHSGKPLPIADSLNRYEPRVFSAFGITCERCHGDVSAHLLNPVPGSILNPVKLAGAVRASICEQCHLTGETRIPNPAKTIGEFQPGYALEDYYTTYVAAASSGQSIKVVSHAEQLALSKCAQKSGDRLWCGTCHNPHDKPTQPAAYFRDRCLSCHGPTLAKSHAAPDRDCVSCHMPKAPARDGGHTAFTNHRIARTFGVESSITQADTLMAWREPDPAVKDRNLALALVTVGLQDNSSTEIIRGYKMLNRLAKDFPNDSLLFTTLGSVLMKANEPAEALKYFRKVIALSPNYAPNYVNAGTALLATNQLAEAVSQLEKARSLDPLLKQAVQLLHRAYQAQGQPEKAHELMAEYDKAMGTTRGPTLNNGPF